MLIVNTFAKIYFMITNKLLTAIAISGGMLIASCGTNEQKPAEETPKADSVATAPTPAAPDTSAVVSQYNKDEAEMLDKHAAVTYKSKDGKSTVKISFIEEENGNKYLKLQRGNDKAIDLSLVTGHDGADVYADANSKIYWESKESGGTGKLTENGKETEYVITNQ